MKYRRIVFLLFLVLLGPANSQEGDGPWSGRGRHARLLVEFTSECCGTDATAEDALDALVREYKSQRGVILAFDSYNWGMEGEHTYCFWLNELNQNEQAEFIQRVREGVKGRRVNLREGGLCQCSAGKPGGYAVIGCTRPKPVVTPVK